MAMRVRIVGGGGGLAGGGSIEIVLGAIVYGVVTLFGHDLSRRAGVLLSFGRYRTVGVKTPCPARQARQDCLAGLAGLAGLASLAAQHLRQTLTTYSTDYLQYCTPYDLLSRAWRAWLLPLLL